MVTKIEALGSLQSRTECRSLDSQSSALSTVLCRVIGAEKKCIPCVSTRGWTEKKTVKLWRPQFPHLSEKAMAPHSSTLAWKIPWTEEPGRLQSTRSLRVRHDWSDLAAAAAGLRRRQWQPTPVLLPGKSHGRRSLVGCSPWGSWESDTTERFHFHFSLSCIGEGNGNPLQCSCLENPRDRGAWWASVYGVAQSRTWLKWLSRAID